MSCILAAPERLHAESARAAISRTPSSSAAPAIVESSFTRGVIRFLRRLCFALRYAPAATFALGPPSGIGSSRVHPENTPPVMYRATTPTTIIASRDKLRLAQPQQHARIDSKEFDHETASSQKHQIEVKDPTRDPARRRIDHRMRNTAM